MRDNEQCGGEVTIVTKKWGFIIDLNKKKKRNRCGSNCTRSFIRHCVLMWPS